MQWHFTETIRHLLAWQVKKGDLVYDPFVGTGSILVAAAHFGAHTIGADIDIRVVRDGEHLGSVLPLPE